MGAVTAGGMPAVLNQNGVTLLGANQGKPVIDAANSALQALFKATNSGLRLVSPSAPSDGSAPPLGHILDVPKGVTYVSK